MNAFARSNLAVATLRLQEAMMKLAALEARIAERDTLMPGVLRDERLVTDARWSVREAQRLIDAATGLDEVCEEMEKADTLPLPPESGARRMG